VVKIKKDINKKVSISKRIVGLTVFIDVLFLLVISTAFLFYTFYSANEHKRSLVLNQTQAIVNSTDAFLQNIKSDAEMIADNPIAINYLKYINAGNDPIPVETDPNYHVYLDFITYSTAIINHQSDAAYDLIFLATEYDCNGAVDGCAVTSTEELLSNTWEISERPWFIDLGSKDQNLSQPYVDAITGMYTFTFVQKVYDGSQVIGYVGVDMSLTSLSALIDNIDRNINKEVAEVLVFLDYENNPTLAFYSNDILDGYFLKDLSEFSSLDSAEGYENSGVSNLIALRDSSEVVNAKFFDTDYQLTFSNLEEFGWQMIVLVDNSTFLSMEATFAILVVAIILLVFLISKLLKTRIRRLLVPINTIIETLEEIKNGNFKVRVNLLENNELKEIGDSINIMSKEIEKQVSLVYENFAFDNVTGLKNLNAAKIDISKYVLSGNRKAAICVFQVENLKNINIIKGQAIGDDLLKSIAKELKMVLENSEFLYTNNHDEFIHIMTNINSLEEVEIKINKMMAHFNDPLIVRSIKIEVKFFVGISIFPTDGVILDDLIKKSDTAVYKAKQLGNKRFLFYNENIAREISYKLQVTEQLAKAVDNKELYLKYQPLIDSKNDLYGFEALVRWNSPVLGEISPQDFIANAEETYLIMPIGNWVLREACSMQVRLREEFKKDFVMSVNVSTIQLIQYDFVDTVKRIVKESDIVPEYLSLELTESVFLNATAIIEEKINDLKSMGIKFSLDDFGTGYASLTYLRQIAFNNIKIDKSFISGIYGTEQDNKIVRTIVNLVHNLDMVVIAEGVETRKQYEYLKQIGTDIFQGFLMSKPLVEKDAIEFINLFHKISKAKRVDVLMLNSK
jgi:diguanylate cyclase (GGDEF)-like protein